MGLFRLYLLRRNTQTDLRQPLLDVFIYKLLVHAHNVIFIIIIL